MRWPHEDNHVPADSALIVEHITAQPGMGREHRFKRSSNRRARCLAWRRCNVTLQIRGENNFGHGDLHYALMTEFEFRASKRLAGRRRCRSRACESVTHSPRFVYAAPPDFLTRSTSSIFFAMKVRSDRRVASSSALRKFLMAAGLPKRASNSPRVT